MSPVAQGGPWVAVRPKDDVTQLAVRVSFAHSSLLISETMDVEAAEHAVQLILRITTTLLLAPTEALPVDTRRASPRLRADLNRPTRNRLIASWDEPATGHRWVAGSISAVRGSWQVELPNQVPNGSSLSEYRF
ncbi:hypothetical protein [Nocardia sp.]|uniref:hypothetical protein n=1 Tax=Nocardia sp. TaxID=1821 RepID=UPI0026166B66|nr:hypothetical protein [Nocardia sp.]